MIKTITIDGNTSVKIKQSPHDMDRYCCVENHSEADMFASCTDSQCTENADGVARIAAGGYKIVDTESYETLYLRGSGEVELTTSAYIGALARSFKHASKGGDAKSISGSAAYTVTDAVDYPLLGLNLYGKSVQDGTPSPDNPVDIISVGDNGFDIILKNDKHFNLLSVRDNGGDIITNQPVSTAVKAGKKATFTVAACGTGLTYQWQTSSNNGTTWVNSGVTGNKTNTITVSGVKESWDGCKYRCIVKDSSGNSETSNTATLYIVSDDVAVKSGSIVLPDVLCGIPVDSGGNYTDKSGQQWICDELIYNADGTGSIIKNTAKINSYNGEAIATPYISTTGALTTGAAVIYQLDTPQISILSTADVMALSALQTYSGTTNISNSDNAEMDVKYCTNSAFSECVIPITTALQAQINELKSAVLSLGGNV